MLRIKVFVLVLFMFVVGCSPCYYYFGVCHDKPVRENLSEIFAQHPEWPERIKQLIRDKEICTGMTPEQVEVAWGSGLTLESGDSYGYKLYTQNYLGDWKSDNTSGWRHYRFRFYNGKLKRWSWSPGHSDF